MGKRASTSKERKGEKFSKGLNGYLLHFEFKIDSDVRNQIFRLGVSLIGGQNFQDFLAGFYPRLPAHGGQDGVVEAEVGLSVGLGSKLEWKRPTEQNRSFVLYFKIKCLSRSW